MSSNKSITLCATTASWLCVVYLTLTPVSADAKWFGLFSDCPSNDETLFVKECTSKIPSNPSEKKIPSILTDKDEVKLNDSLTLKQIQLSSEDQLDSDSIGGKHLHFYSRRQAWNSDESLVLLGTSIYRFPSMQLLVSTIPLSSEWNWSNESPNKLFGVYFGPKPNQLVSWSINENKIHVIHKFSEYEKCNIGQGEGNISNDDKFIVLICSKTDDDKDLISFNLQSRTVLGIHPADSRINWASFSQSGKYVVVEHNTLKEVEAEEVVRFNPDFTDPTLLITQRSHGDLGIDEDGNDVLVMINTNHIQTVRLHDGARTKLKIGSWLSSFSFGHVSCRNTNRPGWCYLSTGGRNRAIGAIKLGAAKKQVSRDSLPNAPFESGIRAFEYWTHHNSTSSTYWAQPKASASPSGRRVVFTTDWDGQFPIRDYVIDIDEQR